MSAATFSQNFEKVDAKVLQYPRFSKVDDLANKIESDFSSDVDKVRAAFFWLAKNIRYNLKEYYNPRQRKYQFRYKSEEEKAQKLQAIKDQLVNTAFRTKMGVCEEYAQSFKKICDLLNIEAAVIKGNVRTDANEIGQILQNKSYVAKLQPIETNILIFELASHINADQFVLNLEKKGVLISNMGGGKLRMVTHLDYNLEMHEKLIETLESIT